MSRIRLLALLLLTSPVLAQDDESSSIIQEVTTEDVKRFLDPTIMVNGLDYNFQVNYLLQDVELYTHLLQPSWALNHWTAVWAQIPIRDFSIPDDAGPSAMGDILVGWGAVVHENLQRRFTTATAWMEVLAPTGDSEKGLGSGTWVVAPGGGIALNPTDKFPIYITGRYLHSLESLAGNVRSAIVEERPELRVRSIQLNFQTAHILPKGFYLAALPSVVINLNQDFNLFSLGLGAGRALNKNFAVSGGYIHYAAGRRTFNQAFTIGVSFIWGEEKRRK